MMIIKAAGNPCRMISPAAAELKDLLDKMGIRRLEKAGFEADDILGTLARLGQNAGHEVHIVSGDKDVFQLVDDHITVIWPVTRQGQSELEIYDRDAVYRRYQLRRSSLLISRRSWEIPLIIFPESAASVRRVPLSC
jgi:5'-3' exonuclease